MLHPSWQHLHVKVTSIHSFFANFLHTVAFTSLPFLWTHADIFMVVFICSCHRYHVQWGFCLPFSWLKSRNQSHCNVKMKIKVGILLIGLSCWSITMENEGMHYAGVHKIPDDVLPCFVWEAANITFHVQFIMMINTFHVSVVQVNVLCLICFNHIMTKPSVCVNISWVWICAVKSYNSIVLPDNGHQVWVAILVWFISIPDHSTRFTNTLLKIFLIHSHCPIAVCFASQHVLL